MTTSIVSLSEVTKPDTVYTHIPATDRSKSPVGNKTLFSYDLAIKAMPAQSPPAKEA